jgi:hypothetical protein
MAVLEVMAREDPGKINEKCWKGFFGL